MDVFEGEAEALSCVFDGGGWMCSRWRLDVFKTSRVRQCCLCMSMWRWAACAKWAI
jgi:hypothetical protein